MISIIQQSGLGYEIGVFATVIEGSHQQIFQLIDSVNEYLLQKECRERIGNLQLRMRNDQAITIDEKIQKFRSYHQVNSVSEVYFFYQPNPAIIYRLHIIKPFNVEKNQQFSFLESFPATFLQISRQTKQGFMRLPLGSTHWSQHRYKQH